MSLLSTFKPIESSNPRGTSNLPSIGQIFTGIRYKKTTRKDGSFNAQFHVSNAMFDEMKLEDNGFTVLIDQTPGSTQFLVVKVPNELTGQLTPKILRHREGTDKGTKFKSSKLEDAMIAAGLIDPAEVDTNCYFKLEKLDEQIEGYDVFNVVVDPDMTKGAHPTGAVKDSNDTEASASTDDDDSDDVEEEVAESPSMDIADSPSSESDLAEELEEEDEL